MTAWHIIDWIAVERNPNVSRKGLQNIQKNFKLKCSSLAIMKDLCNRVKHCQITKYTPGVKKTEKHQGDYSNDYSNDFDVSRLIIELDDGSKKRFEDEIALVISFWITYLKIGS